MAFNLLDPTSIILDSVVMCIVSCLLIAVSGLTSAVGERYYSSVLFNVVAILVIAACAYGIPISKVKKGYARRFAITAAVFAVLSIIFTIVSTILSFANKTVVHDLETIDSAARSAIGTITEVIVDSAAVLLTLKYTKTCVLLTREQQAQQTAMVPPHVMAVQENVHMSLYPTQPAAQPMMVGQPVYQPS